ncbi:phosphatidylinositol 3,4,5-trisphosphate 5-phosphatase 2A-like [Pelodytes ibericus]
MASGSRPPSGNPLYSEKNELQFAKGSHEMNRCEYWYHADLSQVCAEQLLILDGRDGAFLVRPSESVHGAFAICVLYRQQVHTYRVLPDEHGLLSVQSVQGVEVKRFTGLSELVSAYKKQQNGMVTSLQYPARWEGVGSWGCVDTIIGSSDWDLLSYSHSMHLQDDRHALKKQDTGMFSLDQALEMECRKLERQIEITWYSLNILTQVFGHVVSALYPEEVQDYSLNKLESKVLALQEALCVIESKAFHMLQECVTVVSSSLVSHNPISPKTAVKSPSKKMILSDKSQSRRNDPQYVSVFLGTWNMGSSPPPRSISSWLSSRGMGKTLDGPGACVTHDIYIIGTQENPQGDREWTDFLKAALWSQTGKQYKVVSAQSIGGVKIVILVKEEYWNLISHVQTSSFRTGISNTLGNRGAVGVSLNFNGTSLGFVTCQLVSGSERVQKRNQSFGDILRSLTLGDEALRGFQLPMRLTHLFWMGDLNYRINMPVQDILQSVYRGQYHVLLPVDQLNQERERKKVFLGFREEPVTFQPTCRYERGSRSYDLQKAKTTGTRIFAPSWSDRVLWSSYPDTKIKCTSYGCTDDIVTSDHSPVFATFEIGLSCQPKKGSISTFRFQSIEAIIKTHHRSRASIEFRSSCLRGSPQSVVNSVHSTEGSAFLKLGWSDVDLPEITLVGLDLNADPTGHLLLSIRPADGGESYGECCISVRALYSSGDNHFQAFLSQRGEETGSLRGRLNQNRFPEVQAEKDLKSVHGETGKMRESSSHVTCPSDGDPQSSRPSRHSTRRRPASICCASGSYSNAEYFLFEATQSPSSPISPRPHSALVTGEHRHHAKHWTRGEQRSAATQSNRPSGITSRI